MNVSTGVALAESGGSKKGGVSAEKGSGDCYPVCDQRGAKAKSDREYEEMMAYIAAQKKK